MQWLIWKKTTAKKVSAVLGKNELVEIVVLGLFAAKKIYGINFATPQWMQLHMEDHLEILVRKSGLKRAVVDFLVLMSNSMMSFILLTF